MSSPQTPSSFVHATRSTEIQSPLTFIPPWGMIGREEIERTFVDRFRTWLLSPNPNREDAVPVGVIGHSRQGKTLLLEVVRLSASASANIESLTVTFNGSTRLPDRMSLDEAKQLLLRKLLSALCCGCIVPDFVAKPAAHDGFEGLYRRIYHDKRCVVVLDEITALFDRLDPHANHTELASFLHECLPSKQFFIIFSGFDDTFDSAHTASSMKSLSGRRPVTLWLKPASAAERRAFHPLKSVLITLCRLSGLHFSLFAYEMLKSAPGLIGVVNEELFKAICSQSVAVTFGEGSDLNGALAVVGSRVSVIGHLSGQSADAALILEVIFQILSDQFGVPSLTSCAFEMVGAISSALAQTEALSVLGKMLRQGVRSVPERTTRAMIACPFQTTAKIVWHPVPLFLRAFVEGDAAAKYVRERYTTKSTDSKCRLFILLLITLQMLFKDVCNALTPTGPDSDEGNCKGNAYEMAITHGLQLRRTTLSSKHLRLSDYATGRCVLSVGSPPAADVEVAFPPVDIESSIDDLVKSSAPQAIPSTEFPLTQAGLCGNVPVGLCPGIYFDDYRRRSRRPLVMLDMYIIEVLCHPSQKKSLLFHAIQVKNTVPRASPPTDFLKAVGVTRPRLEALLNAVARINLDGLTVSHVLHTVICPARILTDWVTASTPEDVKACLPADPLPVAYQMEFVTPSHGLAQMCSSVVVDVAPDMEAHDADNFTRKHTTILKDIADTPLTQPVLACESKGRPASEEYRAVHERCSAGFDAVIKAVSLKRPDLVIPTS
eukprot:TRINITY_DN44260_c0_g1_i1.p1 TRINITY_DN44260_c0_g1~~TRINITY_DN44260_c0_g1_i1.p1  ORF type:complete len:775 (-),score=74.87 TRINITY_DN44260_c0_g1_i1:115-2439(-)